MQIRCNPKLLFSGSLPAQNQTKLESYSSSSGLVEDVFVRSSGVVVQSETPNPAATVEQVGRSERSSLPQDRTVPPASTHKKEQAKQKNAITQEKLKQHAEKLEIAKQKHRILNAKAREKLKQDPEKLEIVKQKRKISHAIYLEKLSKDPEKLEIVKQKHRDAQAKYEKKIMADPVKAPKRKQQIQNAIARYTKKLQQQKKIQAEQLPAYVEPRVRPEARQSAVTSVASSPTWTLQDSHSTSARAESPSINWDEWLNFPEDTDTE